MDCSITQLSELEEFGVIRLQSFATPPSFFSAKIFVLEMISYDIILIPNKIILMWLHFLKNMCRFLMLKKKMVDISIPGYKYCECFSSHVKKKLLPHRECY